MKKIKVIELAEEARCGHCNYLAKNGELMFVDSTTRKEMYCSSKCARGTSYIRGTQVKVERAVVRYQPRTR
jgi:hypothetical protein